MVLIGAGVPVLAAAVLAVEVLLARAGVQLPERQLDYPAGAGETAVWIGDSTAVGVGAGDGRGAVASVVAGARGHRVRMLAVSGATLHEVLAEQVPQVAAERPAVVFVSVGANDVTHLTRASAFQRDYDELLARLPRGVPVVVLGVPDMGAVPRFAQPLRWIAGWRGSVLDGHVAAAAKKSDATYVDIAGRTGPEFRRSPSRHFSADSYHPSDAGYRLWADAVLEQTAP